MFPSRRGNQLNGNQQEQNDVSPDATFPSRRGNQLNGNFLLVVVVGGLIDRVPLSQGKPIEWKHPDPNPYKVGLNPGSPLAGETN